MDKYILVFSGCAAWGYISTMPKQHYAETLEQQSQEWRHSQIPDAQITHFIPSMTKSSDIPLGKMHKFRNKYFGVI